jgi:hypothetical protein
LTLIAAGLATAGVLGLVLPAASLAHGLGGRLDLPIPDWLFTFGAAAVLSVSFVSLAVLWKEPRLGNLRSRRAPRALSALVSLRAVEWSCGLVAVALLAVTIWSGFAGSDSTPTNFAPTFVYVIFWLGLVPVSILFGDVFRPFNPWRAVGRAVGASVGRFAAVGGDDVIRYPRWLGYWPAALGLFGFAWIELISPRGDDPSTVALATVIYSAITWLCMALFGVERWCDRGEAFSVYFGLLARISPWQREGRAIALRRPLTGLTTWPVLPGAVALLAVMIGSVSYDGFSAGRTWQDAIRDPLDFLRDDVGLGAPQALQAVQAAGLVGMIALIGGLYWLAIAGARTAERSRRLGALAGSFVHTLVPIAFAYVAAHYVSLLLTQGQAIGFLASDPLGDGSDFFGTAGWEIDYGFLNSVTIWYLQVGFVIVGHVAALVLAHDRALTVFSSARAALRSQYYVLGVMVAFTMFALWLLSQAREG